jgi:hypothetical protein
MAPPKVLLFGGSVTSYVDLGEWTAKAVFDANLVHTSPSLAYVKRK